MENNERRKVFIKGRGAFGRAYRGLYDAETGERILEYRNTSVNEDYLRGYAAGKGWRVVGNPKKK